MSYPGEPPLRVRAALNTPGNPWMAEKAAFSGEDRIELEKPFTGLPPAVSAAVTRGVVLLGTVIVEGTDIYFWRKTGF